MKIYRVQKRSRVTVYGILAVLSLIAAAVLGLYFYLFAKSKAEVWHTGPIAIDAQEMYWVLILFGFAFLFAAVFLRDEHDIHQYDQCHDVYLRDKNDDLYYIRLNRELFETKLTFRSVFLRGSRMYRLGMIRYLGEYCKKVMCRENIDELLPTIMENQYTLNNEAAVFGYKIDRVSKIDDIAGGVKFSFCLEGSDKLYFAKAFAYMNDYEELLALIRAKAA